jgi:propionate CoA-transferase
VYFLVNFLKAEQAVDLIKDGSTISTIGMSLACASEVILKEIEKRYLESGHPKNLTLYHAAGQCDRKRGIQHLAHEGLIKRIIGAHWGLSPEWMEMISSNKVEAYCFPQGQAAQLYRSMACGLPGKISKVGLGTFIDPRLEGGRMNERTKKLPNLVKIVNIEGEEYLLYPSIPLDVVIIRGTTADEKGNITCEEEAMKIENLSAVLATKRFGGKVIAQVKRIAQYGTLHPKEVIVPGVFVDAIVVCQNPDEDHRQTSSWSFDPSYSGDLRKPLSKINPLPISIRKVIGRRAMMELKVGSIINLGTGIPNDVVGPIAAEEGILDLITITVESGIYSGLPAGGIDFGIAANADALIQHEAQFDFYNGAGVDFTFMGVGEMDESGNVNSTKFGNYAPGAGGFIDITQNAKNVLFCGSFTSQGLEVDFEGGKVNILKEGSIHKLVKKVQQISFNSEIARKRNQNVFFITERAVFKLEPDGPVLFEISPGLDLKKDIIDQMDFKPIIKQKIKESNSIIYQNGIFGLKEYLLNKNNNSTFAVQ